MPWKRKLLGVLLSGSSEGMLNFEGYKNFNNFNKILNRKIILKPEIKHAEFIQDGKEPDCTTVCWQSRILGKTLITYCHTTSLTSMIGWDQIFLSTAPSGISPLSRKMQNCGCRGKRHQGGFKLED